MRRLGGLLAGAVILAGAVACSGGEPPAEVADPSAASEAEPSEAEPSASPSGDIPVDPDVAPEPAPDDGDEPDQPRSGSRPTLTIAELEAGGDPSSVVEVGDAWCAVVTLATTPGDAVEVTVYEVLTDQGRAADAECGGAPSCVDATLGGGASTSCALAVVPPTPAPASVTTALNVRLTCDTVELCRDYEAAAASGKFWEMPNPSPETLSPEAPSPQTAGPDTSSPEAPSPDTSSPDTSSPEAPEPSSEEPAEPRDEESLP